MLLLAKLHSRMVLSLNTISSLAQTVLALLSAARSASTLRSALPSRAAFTQMSLQRKLSNWVWLTIHRIAPWNTGVDKRANGTRLFCRHATEASCCLTTASSPAQWAIILHIPGEARIGLWRSFLRHTQISIPKCCRI